MVFFIVNRRNAEMGKKKTHEEFVKEVFDLVGDEYTVLDKYDGATTKLRFFHNTEGHEFIVTPHSFLQNYNCPICGVKTGHLNRRKTHEEFIEQVFDLVKDEYTVLEKYKTTNEKIKFIHNACNREFYMCPKDFLRGHRCHTCNGGIIKTHEQFIKEVYELHGNEYIVLDNYKNSSTKIKFRHQKCNLEFYMTPSNFLAGKGCPECWKIRESLRRTKTNDQFLDEVKELVGNEYTFLEEYRGADTKIKVRHEMCENEYLTTPRNFLSGKGCSLCGVKKRADAQRKSQKDFENEVFILGNGEYKVLGEYVKNNKKIKIKHLKCGYEYEVQPWHFIEGNRCPRCKESKGEQTIRKWLEENNIEFIPQKEFDGLVGIRGGNLSYDFYLLGLNILIEFQGKQHEQFVKGFHKNKDDFKKQQEHDRRKREYALQHNIELLEIWHFDFENIEEILKNLIIKGKIKPPFNYSLPY
jgi:hypothetical protein